jgi:hypothetical protein
MVVKRNTSAPIANRSLSRRIASRRIRNKEAATSSVVARGLSLNLQVAFRGGAHTPSQAKSSQTFVNLTKRESVSCFEQHTASSIAYRTFSSRLLLLCWRSWRFAILVSFANEPRSPCPTREHTHLLSLALLPKIMSTQMREYEKKENIIVMVCTMTTKL